MGTAAALVAASSSLADSQQTIARAREVVNGRQASAGRDGGILAVAGHERAVLLRQVHSSNQVAATLDGHAGPVSSVAFSPRGPILATATENGTAQLWDVHSLHPLGKPLLTHHLVSSIAFSPNGRTLAAGNGDNGTVALLGVQSHHLIATLRTGSRGAVNSVAFSPGGRTLATGSENGTVQLWDARSHALLETLSAGPGQVFSVAFSLDGRFLAAAGSSGTIRVWQKGVLWRN